MRVNDDWEVDFLAERLGEPPLLVQVCTDAEADETWEREIRSLSAGTERIPEARALLLTLHNTPPTRTLPRAIEWLPTAAWLIAPDED